MKTHYVSHGKAGIVSDKQELKKWLVASLRCTRNIPCNTFDCPEMKMIFSMANLGPVSSDLVKRFSDEEAK